MTSFFVNLTLPKNGAFLLFLRRIARKLAASARHVAASGKTRLASLGLTPLQITAVIAVFFVTSIGAVGLAWALRKWNG